MSARFLSLHYPNVPLPASAIVISRSIGRDTSPSCTLACFLPARQFTDSRPETSRAMAFVTPSRARQHVFPAPNTRSHEGPMDVDYQVPRASFRNVNEHYSQAEPPRKRQSATLHQSREAER